MDINTLRILVTIGALAAFLGIVWWAYAPARRERFERDALLPFGDEEGRPHSENGHPDGMRIPLTPSPSPARGEGKCPAGNGLSAIGRVNDGSRR